MNYFVLKRLREKEEPHKVKPEPQQLPTMTEEKHTVNITNNYYAPIGQKIDHVDHIEAHFDKDMGMQVDMAEQLQTSQTPNEPQMDTTPIDWCQAGIRAVMAGGHLEFSSDWAAVMKIIREVSVFDTLTPSGMVDMIKNAGTEIDEELMPGVDNIRRVEVNGKFPEWTTKGYDSTSRYLQIAQDFLKGYRQKKG